MNYDLRGRPSRLGESGRTACGTAALLPADRAPSPTLFCQVLFSLFKLAWGFGSVPTPKREGATTATCDKAGQPNDVCPYGQVI
ncbi:MAG: hypothetical protein IJF45_06430, partial [Clostridia bacterium]|nr:hypothetical protein [Clostridia bacterium]